MRERGARLKRSALGVVWIIKRKGSFMNLSRQDLPEAHDVFISYSRKDKEFARRLGTALEGYKPAKDLNAPHRNLVVFRDETDFTGVEYHESIERHLSTSAKMILICSPHARNSSYVNEEVRRFVRTRGANNVISLLLSGIPNNEARPGQEYEMAFPNALLEVMELPLAISYVGFDPQRDRVDKGSFYGSWCTILANLFNASRSEIEQRDKKRQARTRFTAISLITVVVSALSVLSIYAWISRAEAIHQRRLAEQQKEVALNAFYQLTYKVPVELAKFPGTEEIRETLVRDTIASLVKLQQLTPESLDIRRELATNHRLLGGILDDVGKYQQAQQEFKASASFYGPLLQREPKNGLWYRDLAVSLFNSGLMLEKLADKQGACKEYVESIQYARIATELDQQWTNLLKQIEGKKKALTCFG